MLSARQRAAAAEFSTSTASAAPRLTASKARLPLPAKKIEHARAFPDHAARGEHGEQGFARLAHGRAVAFALHGPDASAAQSAGNDAHGFSCVFCAVDGRRLTVQRLPGAGK